MKRVLGKIFGYAFCFTFLTLCQYKFGITGISVAFLYALTYCKEKPWVIATYCIVNAAVYRTLPMTLYTVSAVVPLVFLLIFRKKMPAKFRLWFFLLAILPTQTLKFVYFHAVVDLPYQIFGTVLAVLFLYTDIVALYPFFIRGLRYRFSDSEKICALLLLFALGAGFYSMTVFAVTFFYFACTVFTVLFFAVERQAVLPCLVAMGLGAVAVSSNPGALVYSCVIYAAYAVFAHKNKYVAALSLFLGFGLASYLFAADISPNTLLPVFIGCFAVFVPDRYLQSVEQYKQSYQGKFAMRTVLNRDRTDICKKLMNVASAFGQIETILEEEEHTQPNREQIVNNILRRLCKDCTNYAQCRERLNPESCIDALVAAAVDNGKVSLLDAGYTMTEQCIRLPKMIAETNDAVREFRHSREKRDGIETGKEMVIAQLRGTAELLRVLSLSFGNECSFDTVKERKITEELGYANIIASDVALYGNEDEVTVVVRSCDCDKPHLRTVLSAVLGEHLIETERNTELNGLVALRFCRAPSYGILYGESSTRVEEQSGDTNQAIKLGYDKIMFILSDGMGTGKDAGETSATASGLIEAFYRAGFDHKTTFSCVSKLLSLRKKENFSALDIAIVDTQNADFDFIKQGGRESYIYTENGLEMIVGESLPLGILEDAEPQIIRRHLVGGDLAILLSDGVADKIDSSGLAELFASLHTVNPQVISDRILNAALQRGGKEDDMTVIVIRVVKNDLLSV